MPMWSYMITLRVCSQTWSFVSPQYHCFKTACWWFWNRSTYRPTPIIQGLCIPLRLSPRHWHCSSLNEMPPKSWAFEYVVPTQVGGTIWIGLESVALLEKACHWRLALIFKRFAPFLVLSFLPSWDCWYEPSGRPWCLFPLLWILIPLESHAQKSFFSMFPWSCCFITATAK